MVYALKDTLSGNLNRIYDVAVSGSRTIGEDGRCKEAVGNTVDVKNAT